MQKFCLHNFNYIPFHLPPHLLNTISSVQFRLYCIRQNFPCIPATLSLHFSWDLFYIGNTVSLRRIICRETVSLHFIHKPILNWTELYPCVYILVKTECSKVILRKLCTDCVSFVYLDGNVIFVHGLWIFLLSYSVSSRSAGSEMKPLT
jgi:hypothetical protein